MRAQAEASESAGMVLGRTASVIAGSALVVSVGALLLQVVILQAFGVQAWELMSALRGPIVAGLGAVAVVVGAVALVSNAAAARWAAAGTASGLVLFLEALTGILVPAIQGQRAF